MNYSKINNAPSNAVNNNNGPRFQNKNLNSFRNQQNFPTRPGPPQSGVQVIQAKQKVGKAVGAAAVPAAPTPMNTPSLKREIQTNQSGTVWGGQGSQSNDESSPSLKGMPAPAKPAPWAKSGNTEVEKVEEQKLESSASKQVRSWANADDSEEEDRQDNSHDNEWPDNFREPVDDPLPPPRYPIDAHDDDYRQRYVPPYGRNKTNSRPDSGSRFERHNQDEFLDSKNANQTFHSFNRFSQNRQHVDRDGMADTRNFRGRFENSSRREDDFTDSRRYPKETERSDKFQHFKSDERRNDYANYDRTGDRRYDYDSRYSRNEPSYRRGYNAPPPRPPAHNDIGEYRERSRTLSGDFSTERGNQVSSRFPRSSKEDQEKSNPDVGADIDDIEVSRREAEYLEGAKPRFPPQDVRLSSHRNPSDPLQHNGAYDSSDYKRSGHDRNDGNYDASHQFSGRSTNSETRWEKSNITSGRESTTMSGLFRGQDAVKLSFPVAQTQAEEQSRSVDNGMNTYGSRPISMNIQSAQSRHARGDPQVESKSYTGLFPNEIKNSDDAQEISEVSLNRGESTARPKKLYDPKSDQMEEYKGQKSQGLFSNRKEQDKSKENPDRWTRVSNLEKEKLQENEISKEIGNEKLPSSKEPSTKTESIRKEEGSAKFSQQDERKIMRQKERQNRPPRTKGFLYCYTEKGELERVYSSWEKQQEELEQKKSGKLDTEEKLTIKKRTDSEPPKKSDEPRETWVNHNQQSFPGSKDQIDGKADNPGFLGNEPKVLMTSIEHPSSNLLGQLVPSIFESWNSAADTRVADLSSQSRMPWLTNSTGSANLGSSNPSSFAPGLSGLGTNFPGIISSNPSNSLFSSQRQDWAYGNILHTEPASTSLNTTFSSLNELNNRPSTFATLGIISGLEEPIMHGEKKELPKDEVNEAKYFQREWQRLGLGIGSKQNRGSKQPIPENFAKESHLEAVVTPPVGLVIEAPKELKSANVAPLPGKAADSIVPNSESFTQRQNRSENRNHDTGRGSGPRESRGRGRGRDNRTLETRIVTTTADSERKPRGRMDGINSAPTYNANPAGKDETKPQNPTHSVERIEKPRTATQPSTRKEKSANPTANTKSTIPERSEGKVHHVERAEPANNRNNAVTQNTNNHSRPANNGGNNRNTNSNSSSRGAGGGRGFSGPRAHSEVLPNKGHHEK